jgi:hypothetical protein
MRISKKLQKPFRIAKIQQKWQFAQDAVGGLPKLCGNIWLLRRKIRSTEADISYPTNKNAQQKAIVNAKNKTLKRGAFLTKHDSVFIPFDIAKDKRIDAVLASPSHSGLGETEIYTNGHFVAYKLAEANEIRWYNYTYALCNRDYSITGLSFAELLEQSGFEIHFSYNSIMELILDFYTNNDKTIKILDETGEEKNLFDLIAA